MEFNATFFVSAISFIIFTLIMNVIFYKPLTKIITERQNLINDAYSDAENSNKLANELLETKEKRLQETNNTTKEIINNSVNNAKEKSINLTKEAKLSSHQKIDNAKSKLLEEKENMQSSVNDVIVELAEKISSKILKEDTKITNTELINKVIKK